jgi:hypothetical protein
VVGGEVAFCLGRAAGPDLRAKEAAKNICGRGIEHSRKETSVDLELGLKYGRKVVLAQRNSTRPPRLRESETGVNDAGQPREPLSANKFADRDDTGPRPKSSVISNCARRAGNTMILSGFYPV